MHLVVVFLLLTLSRQEKKRGRHYSQLPPVSVSLSQSSGSSFQSCSDSVSTKTKATQFVVRAVVRIFTGCSVGKISIIILSFRVGPSKNKNADHRVKETSAVMSIQVTHETDLTAFPVETGRKLNVHKTFNLRPVSTGYSVIQRCQMR